MSIAIRADVELFEDLDYVVGFFGECVGVVLCHRGSGDPHVLFVGVVEDDGVWHTTIPASSSYWLAELISALSAAQSWLQENAKANQYGFEFR
jgi:hypothetical protein